MSTIKLRLKDGMRFLSVGSSRFEIVISDEGENSPDGFEVDVKVYENYLKPYAEPVPKRKKKKKKRVKTKLLDLEE
jgi:hypothetical protein